MSAQKNAQKKKKAPFKKFIISIIIGFVTVAFVGSFAYNYAAKKGRTANVGVINGEPVSMGSDSLFAHFYRQYYEEERQKSGDKGVSEETNRQLMRKALDSVIQRTLILQYAEKNSIRVSKKTVLAAIIEKGYYATPEKRFDEKRYENTPESDKQRIFRSEEEQLIIGLFINELINSTKITDVEIRSFYRLINSGKKIEYVFLRYDDVPEEKLKAFYDENPKLFERAHVAHILVKGSEEKANEIYEEVLKNPDQFKDITASKSEDTSKDKGGDLGWFYRKDMVPEFSEAAFKLKKDEISPLVKTVFGYHIIKALDPVEEQSYDDAVFRVKKEYVSAHRDEVEKGTAEKSKVILEKTIKDPSSFTDIVAEAGKRTEKTDYISVDGQYIVNEEKTSPLFELMNVENLIEMIYTTKIGSVGGPVKTLDGEIIFKVTEEKKYDQAEFEKAKDYITRLYTNLKGNYTFNDWYSSALRNSKIVDNFNEFFNK